jgi:hypothetical protein
MYQQPGFTINLHDNDGDSFSDGVFLFFGNGAIIKVADSKEEFEKFLEHLKLIGEQLDEY